MVGESLPSLPQDMSCGNNTYLALNSGLANIRQAPFRNECAR